MKQCLEKGGKLKKHCRTFPTNRNRKLEATLRQNLTSTEESIPSVTMTLNTAAGHLRGGVSRGCY